MSTELKKQHQEEFMAYYGHLPDDFLPWTLLQPAKRLQLRKGHNFQPPRFLFGWAMSARDFFDIAQRCNFLPPDTPVDLEPECLKWKKITLPLNAVLWKQFPEIMDSLPGYVLVHPVVTENRGYKQCIALADSYVTGNRKPSHDDVNTLKEFFGIGEGSTQVLADNQAKWWIEYGQCTWTYMDSRKFNAKSKPWLKEVRQIQDESVVNPVLQASSSQCFSSTA
ncbi:hypothetical protein D9611_011227 [Ephemerocybe angulata]|uniref:Uncharacterized protein n=1 Tax=Ephemerocybe angulata TaxID=980116 RepID=A0A8H5CCB1_9AGAR|nr:hypothetical protein D9611_011227 [Tulosesus angulatus]